MATLAAAAIASSPAQARHGRHYGPVVLLPPPPAIIVAPPPIFVAPPPPRYGYGHRPYRHWDRHDRRHRPGRGHRR
jgi:hypothetical protein